jgi:hypothetical protein
MGTGIRPGTGIRMGTGISTGRGIPVGTGSEGLEILTEQGSRNVHATRLRLPRHHRRQNRMDVLADEPLVERAESLEED